MTLQSLPARRAFTLSELLIVAGVILLLLALLLPALQRMRDASNLAICTSQLRQIGQAFHKFHEDKKHLPTAGSYDSGNPPTDRRDWGWTYEILPYLDHQGLHGEPDAARIRATPIRPYNCPARRPLRAWNGLGKCDYAGNGGTYVETDGFDGTVVRSPGSKHSFQLGTLSMTSDDITDGFSTTILVAEKQVNLGTMSGVTYNDFTENESWCGPGFPDGDIMRGSLPRRGSWFGPARDYRSEAVLHPQMHYRFGSSHRGVMNVLFADYEVRPVRYAIDPVVFMRLCVRHDGEKIKESDW